MILTLCNIHNWNIYLNDQISAKVLLDDCLISCLTFRIRRNHVIVIRCILFQKQGRYSLELQSELFRSCTILWIETLKSKSSLLRVTCTVNFSSIKSPTTVFSVNFPTFPPPPVMVGGGQFLSLNYRIFLTANKMIEKRYTCITQWKQMSFKHEYESSWWYYSVPVLILRLKQPLLVLLICYSTFMNLGLVLGSMKVLVHKYLVSRVVTVPADPFLEEVFNLSLMCVCVYIYIILSKVLFCTFLKFAATSKRYEWLYVQHFCLLWLKNT